VQARQSATGITYWEAVAELPAEELAGYGYTAATAQDSMSGSNPFTAFFVTAITGNPSEFYESPVDSGYSVDNLAPPAPLPFIATFGTVSNVLHWAPCPASDFSAFRLYRGPSPTFSPSQETQLAVTPDTTYIDHPGACYYKLASADIHGNTSVFAIASPASPTASVGIMVNFGSTPGSIWLQWYSPDPVLRSARVYRRTERASWEYLGVPQLDESGYAHFDDRSVSPGARYDYRLGIVEGGSELFTGDTWVEASGTDVALLGARPNPTSPSTLQIEFVLTSRESATLELFDLEGRRIVSRDVGALGAGRHRIALSPNSRVFPGVYISKLTIGTISRSARVVIFE
jgi:hypothetical protein